MGDVGNRAGRGLVCGWRLGRGRVEVIWLMLEIGLVEGWYVDSG